MHEGRGFGTKQSSTCIRRSGKQVLHTDKLQAAPYERILLGTVRFLSAILKVRLMTFFVQQQQGRSGLN